MKGLSLEAARAHAARHGYDPRETVLGRTAGNAPEATAASTVRQVSLPKPVRMTRPEREYGLILEAMKRRGDIVDYRFQGMSLAYSPDPETGIQLRYKCDFVVILSALEMLDRIMTAKGNEGDALPIKIIEVKGSGQHAISAAAKLRFKGAKSAWPMFQFEMHQLKGGEWRRVL